MLDKFDYMEPACHRCGGKDFYYPQKDAPLGRIPVGRIIEKADGLFAKNDYKEAGRLLTYWKNEAVQLKDPQGELAMESELVGFYRKQNDPEKGMQSVVRALELVYELDQEETASGATVFINCATACQAFGLPEDAMPLYRQAEQVYKKTLSAWDARFGGLYNNMALALVALGQFEAASDAYSAALTVMSCVPRGDAECAITWINIAYLYAQQGKDDLIGDCLDQAYKFLRSDKLPHDGYYAFVLEKCAPAFRDFGRPEICLELQRQSEELYAGA